MENEFTQRLLVERLTLERDQIQSSYDVIKKQCEEYKHRLQRLEAAVKEKRVKIVLGDERAVVGREGECCCVYECGGTWYNPNSAKALLQMLETQEWLPCDKLITDMKKMYKSQEEKFNRGQTILFEWNQEISATKKLKLLKRALQGCELRRKSRRPWAEYN